MKSCRPLYITQPVLPPLEEFIPFLQTIWDSKMLTNNGPFHQQFEVALCDYLGVDNIALFCNGTIALVTSLLALEVTGEVITTPYSFVATAHSLLWNGIKPIFVDIDPQTLNLDPNKIEIAITPQTTAILPVHCYGTPCDVETIQKISDLYNLRLIYDAAHAFGVRWRENSLLKYGDLSVLSFHATKVFHTFEGGAIICPDPETKQRIDYLKNFGFADETTVMAPGINGKMNEFSAAFGLLHLQYLDAALRRRQAVDTHYREQLQDVEGIRMLPIMADTAPNYSYCVILVEDAYPLSRDALYQKLRDNNIMARRYFFPLISNMPMYRHLPSAKPSNLPVANAIANKVLCLPIYPTLQPEEQERVIDLVRVK